MFKIQIKPFFPWFWLYKDLSQASTALGIKSIYKTRKFLLSVEEELIKHSSEARTSLENKRNEIYKAYTQAKYKKHEDIA